MVTDFMPIKILPGEKKTLRLSFPYDIPTIEAIKQLPKRIWAPDIKSWEVPDNEETRDLLVKSFGCERIVDCITLLDRFSVELRARKLSDSTIENYTEAVVWFLKTIPGNLSKVTHQEVKVYLIDLNEKENLAPRTVKLHGTDGKCEFKDNGDIYVCKLKAHFKS